MSVLKCSFCKEFVESDQAYKIGIQSFCSKDHAQQKMNKTRKRKQSKKRNSISKDLHRDIIHKDGGMCRFCHRIDGLEVHHVLYKSEGGKDVSDNLITLCRKHHNDGPESVHADKSKWQEACLLVLWVRETTGDKFFSIPKARKWLDENV